MLQICYDADYPTFWKVEISLEKDWVSLNDIKVEGGV